MKLKFLDGEEEIDLPNELSKEERIDLVNEILVKYEDLFRENWFSNKSKICLDILSTYICLAKAEEEKHKHDKEVLSKSKVREMIRGSKKYQLFTDLPLHQKKLLQIVADDEDEY